MSTENCKDTATYGSQSCAAETHSSASSLLLLSVLPWLGNLFFPTDLQLRNDSSILALTLTSAATPFLSESK